jgi:hypothetical protein
MVIGHEFAGSKDEQLRDYAARLAKQTDMQLLNVSFSKHDAEGYQFQAASPFPDLSNKDALEAIPRFFSNALLA